MPCICWNVLVMLKIGQAHEHLRVYLSGEGLPEGHTFLHKKPTCVRGTVTPSDKSHCGFPPHSCRLIPAGSYWVGYRTYFRPGDFEVCVLLRLYNVKLHNPRTGLLASYFKLLIIWNMQTFPLYQAGLLNILLLEPACFMVSIQPGSWVLLK